MSIPPQGTFNDGRMATLILDGETPTRYDPSTNLFDLRTGTLVIRGAGDLAIERGRAFIQQGVYTPTIVQTGTIEIIDGAVPGKILRGGNNPIGRGFWDHDLDDRINGGITGDINFQNGSFGIGITLPLDQLHVNESIRIEENLNFSNSNSNLSFPSIFTINTDKYYFAENSMLGIGTTATEALEVVGNIKLSSDFIKGSERFILPTLGYTEDILIATTLSQVLYNKTLDYPSVQGHMNLQSSGRIINTIDPVHLQDVATKNYVDNFIQGLDPQESVIDKDLTVPPLSGVNGQRYIVPAGAINDWVGQTNNIAQYDSLYNQWIFIVPDHGTMVLVEDENKKYIYNGASWVFFDTLVAHGELQELALDQHLQYQLLIGRSGGQVMSGGLDASDDFTIYSTSNPTRGFVLFQPDGGNVSIGTTTPSELLHIRSQDSLNATILVDTRNSTTNSCITLQNNGDPTKAWTMCYQASSNDFVIQDDNIGERLIIENGTSGAIKFNSGDTEWARFDGGYLAIGTTNPTERLTIGNLNQENTETILVQANNDSKLILNSNVSNTNDADTSIIEFRTKNETKQSLIALVGTDNQFAQDTHQDALFLGAGASGVLTDIQLGTNDQVRLTIKEGGNVGINQDQPNALLTLTQNLDAHNGLTLGHTGANTGIKIGQTTNSYLEVFWNYNATEASAYSEITNKTNTHPLILQSRGGLVGIGVTTPQDRLDILGNIRISGTVNRGTEVFTLPVATDTLLGRISTDTIENKSMKDETVYFVNNDDTSKKVQFDIALATPSTGTTLCFLQTVDRVICFPDNSDTLVGVATTATLTNKDLTGNELNNILTSGGGIVLFPPVGVTGDSVIYAFENQELRNKTLIDPVIIGGVATSPGSFLTTDRIKSLDDRGTIFQDNADNLAFLLNDGGWVSFGTTTALAQVHVVGDMVRFDSNFQVNTDTLYVATTSTNVGINTDTPLYDLHVNGDGKFNNNLIVDGNLTVNGTQTIINSTVVSIEDSLAKYADGNVADTLDIGFYGCYMDVGITKNTGLFRDATDGKYRLYTASEVAPVSNTIDIGATGYTKAELVVGTVDTDNLNHSGNLLFNSTQGVLTSSGNLGILTTTPSETLHVAGTMQIGSELYVKNNSVGLHKSDPVAKVDINGTIRMQTTGTTLLTGNVDPNGTVTLVGSGSSFLSEIVPGDRIIVNGETRTVQTVDTNTSLTVDAAFTDVPLTTGSRIPSMLIFEDSSSDIQFMIRDDGCLGIGVTAVSYPVHVEKQNNSNWSAKFQNGQSTIFMGHDLGLGLNVQTGTASDTSYALKISNDMHPLLRLQNDNKLGIGTDSPDELLHLYGVSAGAGALLANTKVGVWESNNAYMALTHNDVHSTIGSYSIKQHNTGETTLNTADTKDLHFAINDVDKMVLKPTCRLGIGTDDPTDTLHVWGGSMVTGNLKVSGNLEIVGIIESVSTSEIRVQDSILKFADGNTSDIIDIGLYGQYNDGVDRYSGLFRNDADKKWTLFTNLSVEPGTTQVNDSHASYEYGYFVTGGLDIHSSAGSTGNIFFLDENGTTVNEIRSTPEAITFGTSGVFNFESMGNVVMSVDENSNISVSGNFNIEDLTVNNSLNIAYDLVVAGEATFNDLSVTGTLSVGNFGVTGDGTFSGNVIAGGDMTIDGDLTVGGNISFPNIEVNNTKFDVTCITSNFTLGVSYNTLCADASGGPITVTLPASHDGVDPNLSGYTFTVVKTDSSSNQVIITVSGSDLLNGKTDDLILHDQYDNTTFYNVGGSGGIGLWFNK